MKTLIITLVLLVPMFIHAETLTSKIDGIILYLPTNSQIIKKGDVLVKYDDAAINYDIEEKNLDIEYAEEELKDLKSDMERANKLIKAHAVSAASCEDVTVQYHNARISLEKLKIQLKKLESDKGDYTIIAPYDCKVLNVILVTNSGVQQGYKILEIERLSQPKIAKK